MNTVSRSIKGLLLTALTIGVFFINADIQNTKSVQLNTGNKIEMADYFGIRAYAELTGLPDETQNYIDKTTTPSSGSDASASGGSGTTASASAGSTVAAPSDATLPQATIQSVAKFSVIIDKLFDPAVYFFTKHISNFLGSDLVFDGSMGTHLNAIWVISRNIVNVAFVLILLFLAIQHIFSSEEKSDLKKVLPKFAIMLIAVNFSWLGAKLIVDAANVATNVVFAIPNGVKGIVTTPTAKTLECAVSDDGQKTLNDYCMPSSIWWVGDASKTINMTAADCDKGGKLTTKLADGTVATYGSVKDGYSTAYKPDKTNDDGTITKGATDPTSPYYKTITFCWANLDIGKFDSSNAAYQLTYSMAKVQNLAKSQITDPNAPLTTLISKLAIGTIFALFIKIVYLCAFAALFITLVVRMAMLWILVAFSPFIVLMLFLEKNVESIGKAAGEIKEYLSLDAFIKWAFAPAKVAIIWTIGYIMITTGQTATTDIFTNIDNMATVKGQVYEVGSIFMGMNNLQEIIWLIMTIGIIWMGTFAILTKLPVAGKATSWINEQGKSVGKLIGKSPLWAPVIPTIDPTGKLDWKHRQNLGGLAPDVWASKLMNSGYTGKQNMTIDEKATASEKFRRQDDSKVGKLIESFEANSPKDALTKFMNLSGLNQEQIKENFDEKSIKELLDAHTSMDKNKSAEFAKVLYDQAKNGPTSLPDTVVPHDESAEMEEAVRKGVKAGMQDAEIQTKIKNAKLPEDKVVARAVEIKTGKPEMPNETAIAQAIKELSAPPPTEAKDKPANPPATK